MPQAVVLLLVVFFYGATPPQSMSVVAPSAEACLAAGPTVANKIVADNPGKVADARWTCMVAESKVRT